MYLHHTEKFYTLCAFFFPPVQKVQTESAEKVFVSSAMKCEWLKPEGGCKENKELSQGFIYSDGFQSVQNNINTHSLIYSNYLTSYQTAN